VFPHGIQLKMEEELGAFSSAQHKQSRKMRKKKREKRALQLKEVCKERNLGGSFIIPITTQAFQTVE